MLNFLSKPHRWAAVYTLFLIVASAVCLLDAFVIPRSITAVSTAASSGESPVFDAPAGHELSASSYEDGNISINIECVQETGTTVHMADVRLAGVELLRTALADDTFGRNIKAETSEIARANNAILAINGDYYGFRNSGYVLRNGVLYRESPRNARNDEGVEDLVINRDGDFEIISEGESPVDALDLEEIWQIFSFGPALVENSQVVVDENSEVSRSMNSNPRTAIGQVGPLHYLLVVADGRTASSEGLSLLELARLMEERGCITAYNLDGGGSSTMYFNGEVINQPTDGRKQGEREVSDIVYIGY